jgi:hypothetical protein
MFENIFIRHPRVNNQSSLKQNQLKAIVTDMSPLFFSLGNRKCLMVIPDTLAHLNGHTILTYTYNIFMDNVLTAPLQSRSKESTPHLEHIKDPNYMGFVTFEKPGHHFSYTADGQQELNNDEVEEVIENLSHVWDNPDLGTKPIKSKTVI